MGFTYYELGWLFLIYSVCGWCLEVAAAAVRRRTFVNTGVLNLPVSPVYGFSAVAGSIFLIELKNEIFFLFLGGMMITAFLTAVTALVLEHIFHRRWTDYRTARFGFGGSVTLPLLLAGGAGAVFVLWIGNPFLLKLLHLIPHTLGKLLLLILLGCLLLDLSGTLAAVWKWRRYINRMSGLTDNMQTISVTFGNAITRAIRRRLEKSYPNIETKKILAEKAEHPPKEQEKFAEGCSFYKLAVLFFISSLLGDLIETIFCRLTMGVWMSRSSLVIGPFSVVWGMGCVMLTAFLYGHRDKSDRYIFLYGTFAGGAYEYICSVLAELVFGASFWDYSAIPFNLGGRINLLYCFFWGIVAVLWLKIAYPFLSNLIEKIPIRAGKLLTWLMVVFLAADMAVSALALIRYSQRQLGSAPDTQIARQLDRAFPDEFMERVYPKAKIVGKSKVIQ